MLATLMLLAVASLLDAPWRLHEQVEQLQAMRVGERLGNLGNLGEEVVLRLTHNLLNINRVIEYLRQSTAPRSSAVKLRVNDRRLQ